jgi:hypothetical protein
MERKNAEDWDGVKLEVLATEYMNVRREMWTILANRVGEKWTMVEAKVSHLYSYHEVSMLTSDSAWRKASRTSSKPIVPHRGRSEVIPWATAVSDVRTLSTK